MYVGCTVVTRNYLPQARVLATSFTENNPDGTFVVLLADDGSVGSVDDEPFRTLWPADVGVDDDEFARRGAMFGPLGLACSLKGLLLRHLVREHDTVALFLDADSCVYADLSAVAGLASEHELVLSPHLVWPVSRVQADHQLEETFLRYGVFNAGLLGVGTGAEAFLDWWIDRTARRCIVQPVNSYVLDQNWLTLAAAYFPHHVLRDPGCNVMFWNLYDRDIEWDGEVPMISGGLLRHFHFTGFTPAPPQTFGLHDEAARANFPGLHRRPGLARLAHAYASRLVERGLCEARKEPPIFVTLPDGRTITDGERRHYRDLVERAELRGAPEPPDPFTSSPVIVSELPRGPLEVSSVASQPSRRSHEMTSDGQQSRRVPGPGAAATGVGVWLQKPLRELRNRLPESVRRDLVRTRHLLEERILRPMALTTVIRRTDNFQHVRWLGHPIWQNVTDAWLLQETIVELEVDLVIECGTNRGGSAFFMATVFDALGGDGHVVTIDIESLTTFQHPRVTFLVGDSVAEGTIQTVRQIVDERRPTCVLVMLDSDHTADHVIREMDAYAGFVTVGSYLFVQDGSIDELPSHRAVVGPGPLVAIRQFLTRDRRFAVDHERSERYLIGHSPSGWLHRVC